MSRARHSVAAFALLGAGLALLVTPRAAHASALDLFGFGARAPAMAGTGTSFADSYDALYANPAGLAFARHKRMTLGFMGSSFGLRAGGQATHTDPGLGVIVGGDVPIPFGGKLTNRVSIGFGLHVPPTLLTRANAPFPGDPFFVLLENRSQVVTFMGGLGARITKKLSLGIGIIALAALGGSIDVAADVTKRFTSAAEEQLLIDYTPVIGARYDFKRGSVGAVYRGVSAATYDILVTNHIGDALPVTLPPIRVRGVAQYDPAMVTLEGLHKLRDGWAAIVGVTWKHWSAFPPPTENPVADGEPRQSPGFSDTFVPRFAARWRACWPCGATKVEVRFGYAYEHSPAPEQTGKENLLDNDRHILTTGVGIERVLGGLPLHIDAYLQAQLLAHRTHVKDLTLPTADQDPTWLKISSGGRILVGGLTIGIDL